MSTPKLTPWYPADVKPVRDGVYETAIEESTSTFFQYWLDGKWRYCSRTPERAVSRLQRNPSNCQDRVWRGLAEDPNKDK